MMLEDILSNQVLVCACSGWALAQVLKTLIDLLINRSFSFERLYGSGGMPSSHSATACGMMTAALCVYGLSSFEFAVSFILAIVVMHDAMGVRAETGKQARLLNMMLQEDFWDFSETEESQKKLKELVGHTPLQVLCGAVLGILNALFLLNVMWQ